MKSTFTIFHEFTIHASALHVFNAISKPEHLINWWPKKCSGTPSLNEIYNFKFKDEFNWFGRVCQFSQNKSFHIKMTESDSDWNSTAFGFDLEQLENSIKIHFFHSGWESENHEFKQSSFCWAILLNGLKNYVEKEVIIPFEERE